VTVTMACRAFGPHMTMQDIIAKQVRIERQDASHAASLSFDRDAANVFQTYVQVRGCSLLLRAGLAWQQGAEGARACCLCCRQPSTARSCRGSLP
jgi:hypothetical protein